MTVRLFAEFIKKKTSQIKLAAKYEEKASYEMAFLAMWHVLEFGLKTHFGIDIARSMPHMNKIRGDFGGCQKLLQVIHPKNKWRRRRNRIAHSAEEFGHDETYRDYKSDVLDAIDELHRELAALSAR